MVSRSGAFASHAEMTLPWLISVTAGVVMNHCLSSLSRPRRQGEDSVAGLWK